MGVKDQLHAAIDRLSEEEADAILLVLQRERDDIDDRRATAHRAMRQAMASDEALGDLHSSHGNDSNIGAAHYHP